MNMNMNRRGFLKGLSVLAGVSLLGIPELEGTEEPAITEENPLSWISIDREMFSLLGCSISADYNDRNGVMGWTIECSFPNEDFNRLYALTHTNTHGYHNMTMITSFGYRFIGLVGISSFSMFGHDLNPSTSYFATTHIDRSRCEVVLHGNDLVMERV